MNVRSVWLLAGVMLAAVAVVGCQHASAPGARLIGPTWYLQSWTTQHRAPVLPDTDSPPRLVFDSATAARTDDPINTTTWMVTLGPGTLRGVEGLSTAVAETTQSQAADEAIRAVLSSRATWRTAGAGLVVQAPDGSSLTFTSNAAVALGLGAADLGLVARAYQPYAISGTVTLTFDTGSPVITQTLGRDGMRFPRLKPGTYRVTGTVTGGTCTPGYITLTGGQTIRHDVPCLMAH